MRRGRDPRDHQPVRRAYGVDHQHLHHEHLHDQSLAGPRSGQGLVLSRVRCEPAARPVLRLRRVLRPARGRLRVRPGDPRVDRGRADQHLALPGPAAGADHRARRAQPGARLHAPGAGPQPGKGAGDAREVGFTTLACPSTGNLANAVAAAAARAGIRSVVLVPADLEQQKIVTTAVYGGTLVAVEGNYDDVNRVASELAGEHEDWAFVNVNVRPYYAEGSKTLGYEVAEALGWRLPEQVVIPVASGSQLTKVDKAFGELGDLGLVEPTPYRIFGAQASGCSPVSAAFKAGHDVVRPVRPSTIAKSLAIGNPADGPYVLDTTRRTGGAVEDVTDEEIVEGIRLLARTEGIFAETAGGVTVATLRKLLESGQIDPDAETVVFNTGEGLKTLDAVAPHVGPAATIPASADAFGATGLG